MKIYQKSWMQFVPIEVVILFFSFMNGGTVRAGWWEGGLNEMESYLAETGPLPPIPPPPGLIQRAFGVVKWVGKRVPYGYAVYVAGKNGYDIYWYRSQQAYLQEEGLVYSPKNAKGFTDVTSQVNQDEINAQRAGDVWGGNYWHYFGRNTNPGEWLSALW